MSDNENTEATIALRKHLAVALSKQATSSGFRLGDERFHLADAILDLGEISWSYPIMPPGPATFELTITVTEPATEADR